ncbi:MAG: efflux RND transporter periplasmic adaptor subunit [Spirochaetaceae bacterium]|jgi:RND family efflux transporter MFP subunit|nr:efflux RND transporter periplasmic adaptor subunit [Spirochaetaceae bacterium]
MKPIRILIPLLIFLSSCSGKDATSAASGNYGDDQEVPPLAVEVVLVEQGKLIPYLELSGTVEGINEVSLLSRNFGQIEEVYVGLGDRVEEGQLLVRLEDNLSLLNLRAAEESRNTARIEFEALQQSYNTGGTSRRDFSAAQNRLASAEAALEQARQNHRGNRITSPINGYISALDRSISKGNSLQQGQLVAHIIDSSSWIMEGYLGESQIGLVTQDQQVQVSIPSAGSMVETGKILAVSPGGDLTTGSYKIEIKWTSDNPRLRSGMTAMVKIPTSGENQGLLIPSSAVVKREGKDYVFLDNQGIAEAVAIKPGPALGNRMIVLEGLSRGDRLVVSGLNGLAPDREIITTLADRREALE